MRAERIATQVEFSKILGVDKTRLNNPLVGYSLSIDLALQMRRKFPGLTTDWLYEGAEEGLSSSMRDKLRAALAELRHETGARA